MNHLNSQQIRTLDFGFFEENVSGFALAKLTATMLGCILSGC